MNTQSEFHTLSDLLRWLILEYWSQPREQVPITGEYREEYIQNVEECLGPAAKPWPDPLMVDSPVRSPSFVAAETWLRQYEGVPPLAALIGLYHTPNAAGLIPVALDTPDKRDALLAIVTQADLELAGLLVPQYANDPLWAELHRIINDVEREDQTKPTLRARLGDGPRRYLRDDINAMAIECGLTKRPIFTFEPEGPRDYLIVRHPGAVRSLRIEVWSEADAGRVPRINAAGFTTHMRAWQAAREAQLNRGGMIELKPTSGKKPVAVGMSWQEAMLKAESHVKRNGWPGHNALAKLIGCSRATLRKAVAKSSFLKARKAEHEHERTGTGREVPLTDAIADDAAFVAGGAGKRSATDEQDELQRLIAEQAGEERREENQWAASKKRQSRQR